MALIGLYGLFAAAAPGKWLYGVAWVALGLLLIVFPPRVKVGRIWLGMGLGLLLGASLAFLPAQWFAVPSWRTALEALGQATGPHVTIQPAQTAVLLGRWAVSLVAAWYLLGHRGSDRVHLGVALLVALGIAAYGIVSVVAGGQTPPWAWDPDPGFGLFGNRNHTATVLVMGAMLGLGLMMEGVRSKRGAVAGLAAFALVVCIWGLLGFSLSRAGLLLLGAGSIVWLAGQGRRYVSGRMLGTLLGFALVAGMIFWWADTGLQQRVESAWNRLAPVPAAASDPTMTTTPADTSHGTADQPFDFRLVIWRDTLALLSQEPATGVGLGQFPAVFPQYREHSAIHAKCWHPESNWLLLAAEAGILTAGLLAATVGVLFVKAFRAGRQHRGWPLTLASLLAALVVPVHGLFDVPGHHLGIALTALLLVALTFRPGDAPALPCGRMARSISRLTGGAILLAGVGIFVAAGPDKTPPVLMEAGQAATAVNEHYAADMAEKNDPARHPPQRTPDGKAVDQLEVAQGIVNAALKRSPLDPELHYLRGLLSVNFSDEEAIADQAFAVQRLLEPDWVNVPYRQGLAWMTIDPARAGSLWQEALRRAQSGERIRPGSYWSPAQLVQQIKAATAGHPALAPGVAQLEESLR